MRGITLGSYDAMIYMTICLFLGDISDKDEGKAQGIPKVTR